jgi:hypothetical protein
MLSVELVGGMLLVELAKVVDGLLWHNGMTDSMPEVELDWLGRHVGKARVKMESIVDGVGSIAWCG